MASSDAVTIEIPTVETNEGSVNADTSPRDISGQSFVVILCVDNRLLADNKRKPGTDHGFDSSTTTPCVPIKPGKSGAVHSDPK